MVGAGPNFTPSPPRVASASSMEEGAGLWNAYQSYNTNRLSDLSSGLVCSQWTDYCPLFLH